MSLRHRLKLSVELALVSSGLPRIGRWRRRGDVLVLAYHDIIPAGTTASGDRSLHLPQRAFAAQLDLLSATHDVVALGAVLEGRLPSARRPRAVITFDDAYAGAVSAGVEELAARGLPATIFVAPAFVNGGAFWWDLLASDGDAGLSATVRAHALDALAGKGTDVVCWAREHAMPLRDVPSHMRGASEQALAAAARVPGITLASHTWSHPNLPRLSPEELDAELTRPLSWLRERFATVLPCLSYPYGLSSAAVERAAERAGHEAAFRIDGGWMRGAPANRFALPRLDIPSGLTPRGFQLRSAGVLA